MIEVQPNHNMIVQLKAFVAQLDQLHEDLEQAKKAYTDRRRQAVAELASLSQEAVGLNPDAVKELVHELYWHAPTVNAKEIADIFGLPSAHKVRGIAGPAKINRTCKDCGAGLTVDSRSNLKYYEDQGSWARDNNTCPDCDKRRWEASMSKAAEERLLEAERKRAYLESIAAPELDLHTKEAGDLRSMPYRDYLQTNHWKTTRYEALRRAGYSCQLCNAKKPLHVHHRTYERRGCEEQADLIVLCADCHAKFHDKLEPTDN